MRSLAGKPRSSGKLGEGNGGTGWTPILAVSEPPSSVDQFAIAFQRTLTADGHPGAMTRSSPQSFLSYSAWQSGNSSGEISPEVLREFADEVEESMEDRVFFVAEDYMNPFMGIALESVEPGDYIGTFLGGETPYILRPRGEERELGPPAYVDGIMCGEAMDWTKKDRFEYTEFILV